MPVQAPQPQDTQAIVVIVILLAGLCVRFWRTTLLLFAVILIVLVTLGVIAEVHAVHDILR